MGGTTFLVLSILVLHLGARGEVFERPTVRFGETKDPHVRTYFDLKEHIQEIHHELSKADRLEGMTDSPICDSSNFRRRQEIGDITQRRWDAYGRAVLALRNSFNGQGLDAFEQFAEFHNEWSSEAHGSEKFLPWHRWFLYYYETALRKFKPRMTIPYWNWARDANSPRDSIAFTSNRLGSARDGSSIGDGVFIGWWSAFPTGHFVERWLDPDIFLENEQTVRRLIRAQQSVCDFMNDLEIIHGFPHLFVGGAVAPFNAGRDPGDMTLVAVSPNDATFFSHHAFVDKIWEDYLKRNPNAWCNTTWSSDYVIAGVNKTVASTTSGFEACVRYAATRRGPPVATSSRLVANAPVTVPGMSRRAPAQRRDPLMAQAISTIKSSAQNGNKARHRAAQAELWARLSGLNPSVAEEVAANISAIDPTA